MNKKFTLNIQHRLVNRMVEEALAGSLTKHNYSQRMRDDRVAVMGVEVLDEPVTHAEQEYSQLFVNRLKAALKLVITLRMIKEKVYRVSDFGSHFWMSTYVVTRLGRLYFRLPRFFQFVFLAVAIHSLRFIGTAKKYKWLTGVVSFIILSVKVWHSGLIDKTWIGISAFSGVAVVWLMSIWR